MVDVPALTPVTTPLVPIVATDDVLLAHVPPAVASLSPVVSPAQTVVVPDTEAGRGLMTTTELSSVLQHPADDCALK